MEKPIVTGEVIGEDIHEKIRTIFLRRVQKLRPGQMTQMTLDEIYEELEKEEGPTTYWKGEIPRILTDLIRENKIAMAGSSMEMKSKSDTIVFLPVLPHILKPSKRLPETRLLRIKK